MNISEGIETVRKALGNRTDREVIKPVSLPQETGIEDIEEAISIFSQEVEKLSGTVKLVNPGLFDQALQDLIKQYEIQSATIWTDERTQKLGLADKLQKYGINLISATDGKYALENCDLGITTVDYAIPQTGTIGLLASPEKPKAVSLMPRVHLAILEKQDFKPNLAAILQEAKNNPYLILISGPSRTSDIELILTLGVHGPKNLVVWILTS